VPEEDPLLTVVQVAEIMNVTGQTIHNWIKIGKLPAVKVARAVRIRRSDVDRLIEAHSVSYVPEDADLWDNPDAQSFQLPGRRRA
jgi:excisionase family DNA binding protein